MTDVEKKKYLPQIAATLKYGRYWEAKRKLYIILFTVFIALLIAFLAIGVYCAGIEQIEPFDDTVGQITLAILTILALSPSIVFLIPILKNERTRKEILLWLDDAIEMGAYSHLVGTSYAGKAYVPIYKIKVKFKLDGKHISCFSRGKFNGFDSFWEKFADKEVKILYSPKYGEVIILNEPKNK